jgi:hypothetical protein
MPTSVTDPPLRLVEGDGEEDNHIHWCYFVICENCLEQYHHRHVVFSDEGSRNNDSENSPLIIEYSTNVIDLG